MPSVRLSPRNTQFRTCVDMLPDNGNQDASERADAATQRCEETVEVESPRTTKKLAGRLNTKIKQDQSKRSRETVTKRTAQDEEPIKEVVFRRDQVRNSTARRVVMCHASSGTEYDVADVPKLYAKVDVFVNRAAMQKEI